MSLPTQYKVYFTPRINDTEYGDQIDVSDRVRLGGLPNITLALDSSDYDVGVFTYSDVSIKCSNDDGMFNDQNDSRSMFNWSRDLTKVEIVFFRNIDISTITFRGIISDDATRVIASEEQIEFRVLSRDSIIRDSVIETSLISNGVTISEAIYLILNSDEITRILNVSVSNITVPNDVVIDDGSVFDNSDKRSSLNQLLLAGNAVMLIDEDDNVIVRSRNEDTDEQIIRLYGPGDLRGRENILDIDGYNNGLHRVFNVVTINDRTQTDVDSITQFGARKKEETLDFITTNATIDDIASEILTTFKAPKIELMVKVDTDLVKEVTLLQRVVVDYPYKYFPAAGARIPICGAFLSDEATTPYISGSIKIPPNLLFKVIEKQEDPDKFVTKLKLRQVGTTLQDGYVS